MQSRNNAGWRGGEGALEAVWREGDGREERRVSGLNWTAGGAVELGGERREGKGREIATMRALHRTHDRGYSAHYNTSCYEV